MVQLEQKEHIFKTTLIAWIRKRQAAKSPSVALNLEFTMNTYFIVYAW